jgi:hypothetical protein
MDKYDKQIKFLTANPERITRQWESGIGLFQFIDRSCDDNESNINSGCLTMIRSNMSCVAIINRNVNNEITEQIRNDERIPINSNDIKVEHLPIFAEWQRKVDQLEGIKS